MYVNGYSHFIGKEHDILKETELVNFGERQDFILEEFFACFKSHQFYKWHPLANSKSICLVSTEYSGWFKDTLMNILAINLSIVFPLFGKELMYTSSDLSSDLIQFNYESLGLLLSLFLINKAFVLLEVLLNDQNFHWAIPENIHTPIDENAQ